MGVLLVTTSALPAQPLADKLPEGTVLYVGWRGGQNVPPGYAESHLKAVLAQSNLDRVFTQMLPNAIRRIAREEPDAEVPLRTAYELMTVAWNKPTAIALVGMDYENYDTPMLKAMIATQAGADAPKLGARIAELLGQIEDEDVPVASAVVGDTVVLTIGYTDAAAALTPAKSLASSAAFKGAIGKVHADPVMIFYADVERLIAEIDTAVARSGEDDAEGSPIDYYRRIRDASGLKGLERIVATSAFESRQFATRMFVEAPAPRTGLLAVAEGKPLDPAILKIVPRSATFVATARFDAAKLVGVLRQVATEVDPQAGQLFDQGIGAATIAVGRNVETDLLEPLGEHWIAYASPEIAGKSVFGYVLANKLDDPEKAKQGLSMFSIFLSNTVNTLLRQNQAPVQINGRSVMFGNTRVYYVAVPLLSPAWAIEGDYAYFGFFPQTVAGAVRVAAKNGPAITDNPAFKQVMEQLGNRTPDSLMFTDLPAVAPDGYANLLAISRLVLGVGDLFGVASPEPVVPPYDVFAANLTPIGAISWTDESGFHTHVIEPFPASSLLQITGVESLLQSGPLMASILLPSLNRARETADRVKSASNLRQIGMVAILHANENRNQFPQDLATAAKAYDVIPAVFDSPLGDSPGGDYVYLWFQGMSSTIDAEVVVAFDAAALDDGEGTNVLFGDGHVEWLTPAGFDRALERSREIEPRSADLETGLRLSFR
jgi:prepilin-type processing-associated H-X9-DG protein